MTAMPNRITPTNWSSMLYLFSFIRYSSVERVNWVLLCLNVRKETSKHTLHTTESRRNRPNYTFEQIFICYSYSSDQNRSINVGVIYSKRKNWYFFKNI